MFQEGFPCYLGLNSGPSFSINLNKTRKHFSRNIHGAHMFPQCIPVSPHGNHCFQSQFLLPRCRLCFRYTARNFNENPSMRAVAESLRGRASKQSSNFCEQLEQRPNFASTFKLDGAIRHLSCARLNYSYPVPILACENLNPIPDQKSLISMP